MYNRHGKWNQFSNKNIYTNNIQHANHQHIIRTARFSKRKPFLERKYRVPSKISSIPTTNTLENQTISRTEKYTIQKNISRTEIYHPKYRTYNHAKITIHRSNVLPATHSQLAWAHQTNPIFYIRVLSPAAEFAIRPGQASDPIMQRLGVSCKQRAAHTGTNKSSSFFEYHSCVTKTASKRISKISKQTKIAR